MFSLIRTGIRGVRVANMILPKVKLPPCAARGLASFPGEELDLTEGIETAIQVSQALKEPTLASLGLGGWTPPGMVQSFLEYVHIAGDVPWWGTIVIGTVCVRLLIFPLVIKTRRDAANMHNNMPALMHLQKQFTQARESGDRINAERYAIELVDFMKRKSANPFKQLLAPIAQFPFFISFFMGLRQMASLPVESMKTGGIMWFEDLTVIDPLMGLPLITSATLFATIELGTDTGKLPSKHIKTFLRVIPIMMLPVTTQFPAGMLCYWASTNFISLIQAGILKLPAVQKYFKIPDMIQHPPSDVAVMDDFRKGAKESFNNIAISQKLQERKSFMEELHKKQMENQNKK